jgi:hypothetical protein
VLTALPAGRRRLLVVGLGAALLVPLSIGPAGAQAPAGPAGTALSAAGGTVVGRLVRASADVTRATASRTGERSKLLSWIEPANGAPVRVPTDQVDRLPVGAKVRVTVGGAVTDAAAAAAGQQPARQVLSASVLAPAAAPRTSAAVTPTYTDEVTVVKVLPKYSTTTASTTTDTTSIGTLISQVTGPVADYWQGQSRGRVHITAVQSSQGDDWLAAGTDCSNDAYFFLNEVAARIGWTAGTGKHLLIYIPSDAPYPCVDGVADIGASITAGGRAYVRGQAGAPAVQTSLIARELGHNFGLGNSSTEQCDGSVENGLCLDTSNADLYDVMGDSWQQMGALNAQQQYQLGVLPSAEDSGVPQLRFTWDRTLNPTETSGGTRVVSFAGQNGPFYTLEYRTPVGQDAWLGDSRNLPGLDQGVILHIQGDGARGFYGDTSLLVDTTPSAQADWSNDTQVALKAGRSVWLTGLGYYVTVKSTTPTAAVIQIQENDAALPRDLDSNALPDLLSVDPSGVLYRYDGNGTGGFTGRVVMGRGWQGRDLVTMAGDWDGTGMAQDVIARDGSGNLWLYTGAGRSAAFTSWRIIGRGWQGMSGLFSPGDWNGDGNSDLIARRRSDNSLWLYPGNGAGGFLTPRQIGSGWGSMSSFEATGDFDLNGAPDLIVRRTDGALLLYRGDGHGGFAGGGQVIATGWNAFSSITGVGDWDGDGAPDLLARKTDGTMWLYPGDGAGGFLTARQIGTGWGSFRMAV